MAHNAPGWVRDDSQYTTPQSTLELLTHPPSSGSHKKEFEKEEQEILDQLYKGWLHYWNHESMKIGHEDSRRFYDFKEMLSYDMFGNTTRGKFIEHWEAVFPYFCDGQMEYKDLEINVLSPTHAYSTVIQHTWGKAGGDEFNTTFRRTGIAEKKDGQWKWIHEHLSFPVNMATLKADFTGDSKVSESFKFQE